jgi:hypothetical protein
MVNSPAHVDFVLFCFDHTYIKVPKLSSPFAQRRTYFGAKNVHVVKSGTLEKAIF